MRLDSTCFAQAPHPHFVFIMVDDLGWADVGFHQAQPNPEVQTPNMDALVAEGVELTRHYVYYDCTPSRSSVQSGRLPVHVTQNLFNPDQPDAGIPKNMTGFAEKMKVANYSTHFVGKWDAGMATPAHTPQGRGYDTSLLYFSHKNNYWTQATMQTGCPLSLGIVDLWMNDAPANNLNGTNYEEYLWRDQVVDVIQNQDPDEPMFLFFTPHVAHCPLQVPEDQLNKFNFMTNDESECSQQTPYIYPGFNGTYHCRQTYLSMVNLLDDTIGNITTLLKAKGMWNNTLIVLSADNGGPLVLAESGANNYPLRGGKYSQFEGGIRSAAFVSGGYLPPSVRGTQQSGLIHIADWYATFSTMVGVDPYDERAAASGLPPVDGLNMWPLISGQNSTSPRVELPISNYTYINGNYKLITNGTFPYAGWTGIQYPNSSSPQHDPDLATLNCANGCLFDVANDPTEHDNIAAQNPAIVAYMQQRLNYWVSTYYNNNEQGVNSCPQDIAPYTECACWMAMNRYGGFFGPYQEL